MIRERQIQSSAYSSGATVLLDLPRDAVFHMLEFSIMGGTITEVQGAASTGNSIETNFPFSLIRNLRLIRNGSDVIWQGSGAQLAKEHYYLNNSNPWARLYTNATGSGSGGTPTTTEAILTGTSRGLTVPANSDGVGANCTKFAVPTNASLTTVVNFDMQMELWLQMGPEDGYFGSLVDARGLATFQVEITWATPAQLLYGGAVVTSDTIAATMNILSIDQDNVDYSSPFGTFKRSSNQQSQIPFGSNNFQILLPRGNYFHGIVFQTLAYKAASTSVQEPEDAVLGLIDNRINSNFSLRRVNFNQLQAKNVADNKGRHQPWSTAQGCPQGWGFLYYPVAGDKASELVPSYVMDQFDLQIQTNAIGAAQNGTTTAATNPTINLLFQEIIPGVDVGASAPRGAQQGSSRMTTTKPYG